MQTKESIWVTKQPTKTKSFNTNNQKCKIVIYENQKFQYK